MGRMGRAARRFFVASLFALAFGVTLLPLDSRTTPYQTGAVLNQIGPSCVAYAFSDWLHAQPLAVDGPSPYAIYQLAQRLEGNQQPRAYPAVVLAYLYGHGYIGDIQFTDDTDEAA